MNEAPDETRKAALHAEPIEAALDRVGADAEGLSSDEASRRLETHGPNALPVAKPRSAILRFLTHFHNVLIYVLLAAAVVTAALGEFVDMALILLVVLANALIGFIQEGRAEMALSAIRAMVSPQASVLREGRRVTIDAAELVPGDVVLLEAGDRVPADLRLLRARNLRADEAALTGESVPVDKSPEPVEPAAPLGDRSSMAYSGTFVAAGQGAGLVVATGQGTELGRISAMLSEVAELTTPLIRQMNQFGRQLTVAILAVSAAVFLFAVLLRGYAWPEAFMAMVGLAVAAIPEGLPAVMTITLAIGVQRMAGRNAIIRRLPAIETLGSVSVICTDKTGTLTRNEMSVRQAVTARGTVQVTGEGYAPEGAVLEDGREIDQAGRPDIGDLARAAVLCNDATLRREGDDWHGEGDPMEAALVAFAAKAGAPAEEARRHWTRADAIPFDSRHRYMATLDRDPWERAVIHVKGAPERVIAMCEHQLGADGEEPLDAGFWSEAIDGLANDGQRVLALALKESDDDRQSVSPGDIGSLTLIGLVGLIDPPRAEAITAVGECQNAGIRVKMITGDHAATAAAIGRQIDLADAGAIRTGLELEEIDRQALRRIAAETAIFARAAPEHKLSIVEALQAEGATVAMTGDGVNDAPALKRADVGVAMGRKGTEAAKEAADMVLADDSFASIAAAVSEGRTVYDNLMKVIGWTLPTNGGQAFAIIGAILLGMALPITPVQILWVNMITAVGLGLVFAFEPPEPDVMRRPPRRPDAPILSGFLLWRIGFVTALFVLGVFGMFVWAIERGSSLEEARTIAVNTIVAMQIFYLFNVRFLSMPSLTLRGIAGTPAVLIGVGSVLAAQFLFTYAPFLNRVLESRPLALSDGLAIVGVGIAVFTVLELEKLLLRRFRRAPAAKPARA
jgi:magnesium-transporting ATPase (P-type)